MSKPFVSAIMVGCGRAGVELHHGPFRFRGVEYVAAVDPNRELAERVAKSLQIPKVYANLSEALTAERADFVDIATPPKSHFELAAAALRAGVNVFVEKPMTETAAEATELKAICSQTGRKLVTSHNHKYMAGVRQALRVFESGRIGTFLNLNFNWAFIASKNRMMAPEHWAHDFPGGVLLEGNPHPLYIARAFAGELQFQHASGRKISKQWPHVEADEISILLAAKTGYVNIRYSLHMEQSYSKGAFCGGFVLGTKGALFFDYARCIVIDDLVRGGKLLDPQALKGLARSLLRKLPGKQSASASFQLSNGTQLQTGTSNGFGLLADAFLAHLTANAPSPVSLEEAVESVHLNCAIGDAVRAGVRGG